MRQFEGGVVVKKEGATHYTVRVVRQFVFERFNGRQRDRERQRERHRERERENKYAPSCFFNDSTWEDQRFLAASNLCRHICSWQR